MNEASLGSPETLVHSVQTCQAFFPSFSHALEGLCPVSVLAGHPKPVPTGCEEVGASLGNNSTLYTTNRGQNNKTEVRGKKERKNINKESENIRKLKRKMTGKCQPKVPRKQ